MVADVSKHRKLILALEVLDDGDSAGFEDALWLAFGDGWTRLLQRLLHRRIVRYHTREDAYSITDHGRDVLRNLRRESMEIERTADDEPSSMSA